MRYKLIHKNAANQPSTGTYSNWKEQIAEECFQQCVYCAIHVNHWGGLDNFHVEHFRPKSIAAFKKFVNDIANLFLACPVCNRFKSDDWPADPDLNIASYANPSLTDYSSIFDFDDVAFTIGGNCVSANFMIHRMYLNRPQLIHERREYKLSNKEVQLFKEVAELASEVQDKELLRKAFSVISAVRNHLAARETISPYKLAEIRKS